VTPTEAPPPREPRCRYLRKSSNPCANPALDPDSNAIWICARHAAQVMALVAEHREAARKTTRRAR
jgi:hypothetical protein